MTNIEIKDLVDKYLKELDELDKRTARVSASVQASIAKADKCLTDWTAAKGVAENLTKGITNCLDEIKKMNVELTETVNQLNHLSREMNEVENQINNHRIGVSNLESDYLGLKKDIESIYTRTVTILNELSKTIGFNSTYSLTKHLNINEMNTFLQEHNKAFRISPEFKTPLFEPVVISADLLFVPNYEEPTKKADNKNNFSTETNNTQSKNQQENA